MVDTSKPCPKPRGVDVAAAHWPLHLKTHFMVKTKHAYPEGVYR